MSPWEQWRRWLLKPKALFGVAILAILTLMRLYAALFHYDPVADVAIDNAFQGMGGSHFFGTDQLGRDVFIRLIHSTEAFYMPGLVACLLATMGGVAGGALAGYFGGLFADAFRYFSAIISSIPRFILILLVLSITGEGIYIIAALTGLIYVPVVGETVFRKVQHFGATEFIEAAKAHGLKDARILIYHILYHNCLPAILRHLIYLFGYVIIIETSLSYLGGFGRQEPQPSWGNMVAAGRDYMYQGQFLAVVVPVVAIGLTVLGLSLLGDAVGEWEEGSRAR